MTGKTHLIAGLCTGLFLAAQHEGIDGSDALVVSCTVLGAMLPDLDSTASTLGRRVLPISLAIHSLFGHRTILHAPLTYLVGAMSAYSAYPQSGRYISALIAGVISHIALDLLNPAGLPLLWPYPKRFHIASFKSNGFAEWLIRALLHPVVLYLFAALIVPIFP